VLSMHLSMVLVLRGDCEAHPRVNTALESSDFALLQRSARIPSRRDKEVIGSGWLWNQVSVHDLGTFRSGRGVARQAIQNVHKAATKPLHPGERMGLARKTLDIQGGAFACLELVWRESPCARRLVCRDLSYETSEGDGPAARIADAGAGSEDGIETGRIAIVSNVNIEHTALTLGKRRGKSERQQETAQHQQNWFSHFPPFLV
jgi:hypothetical protein